MLWTDFNIGVMIPVFVQLSRVDRRLVCNGRKTVGSGKYIKDTTAAYPAKKVTTE